MSNSQIEIKSYYDKLAATYDEDRFANSYGWFINQQERSILTQWLRDIHPDEGLDLACGTGRFLDFSHTGADISPEMIAVSADKFPQHTLVVANATELPFADQSFSHVTCFHLLMHLDKPTAQLLVREVYRVLKPGGTFIVDVPSGPRRKLTGYQASGWHAGTNWFASDLKSVFEPDFEQVALRGISMMPLHRLSASMRQKLVHLDAWLGNTPLKTYASYWMMNYAKR
ncbi:MAG: class I SAM-dependent methyltransferase [Bacteroidetes bacterium]|nr:class I SAM-dependent methyltransferase [Bacteroidota bacterium]